jgi:hypothetical protein
MRCAAVAVTAAATIPNSTPAAPGGGNGVFKPTIVANGRVIGTWKRTVKARHVESRLVRSNRSPNSKTSFANLVPLDHGLCVVVARRPDLTPQASSTAVSGDP